MTDKALLLLSSRVRLDFALQHGAESLRAIAPDLSLLTLSLSAESQQWASAQRIIDFLFPASLPLFSVPAAAAFLATVRGKDSKFVGVLYQVM